MIDNNPIEEKDDRNAIESVLGVNFSKKPNSRFFVMFGIIILVVFFGGFALWSSLAPIESAAIASGKVVVTGNRRTIQHLEGGIIDRINVRDGENVHKGQILVSLENTRSHAAFKLTQGELYRLMTIEARLSAERDNAKSIHFNKKLQVEAKKNKTVLELMRGQETIFDTNQASFLGNISILEQQITQLEEQIKGAKAQLLSTIEQYDLIEEEVVAVKELADKRLIEKPRLLELQRAAARLQGVKGETVSKIAVLNQKIGETKTKIHTMKADRLKEILSQLRDSHQKIADLMKKEIIEGDVLRKTEIRSPQDGTIVDMKVHTIGGVIKPGETLMDIVPEEQLVIDARVSPMDIDIVHKGLIAKVDLIAFKTRNTPTLQGEVVGVSADSFTDETTGELYYKAKIELDEDQLMNLSKSQELYPGMPVQVMIITDNRTLFNYLFTPVKDSFGRAFREQ
ncbi:MAG: secretion protein HlyD [Coxiellaceae bacterium]|nr:secretion protein HlyD [Coxiellaceae bacterium]|tara:strand:- start:6440 stop:7804 length:1365 start_codon:yes stop_codon:yes gene_type:complete